MSVSKILPLTFNPTHMIGRAEIKHAKGSTDVFFVAPNSAVTVPAEETVELDGTESYFTSRLLAEANYKDVSNDVKVIPSLLGRSLSDMTDFLGKTSR